MEASRGRKKEWIPSRICCPGLLWACLRRVGLGRESPTALGGKGVLASKVSLPLGIPESSALMPFSVHLLGHGGGGRKGRQAWCAGQGGWSPGTSPVSKIIHGLRILRLAGTDRIGQKHNQDTGFQVCGSPHINKSKIKDKEARQKCMVCVCMHVC